MNEFWCIYYAMLPEDAEVNRLEISEEEMQHMMAIDKEWHLRNGN